MIISDAKFVNTIHCFKYSSKSLYNFSLILFFSSSCDYSFSTLSLVWFLSSSNYCGLGISNYKFLYCSSKYSFPPKYSIALIFSLSISAYLIMAFWGYWYLYIQISQALYWFSDINTYLY